MNGFFDVKLFEAPDLDARAIASLLDARGKATPELDRALAACPVTQHLRGSNLVFDNFAAFIYFYLFSGGNIDPPYNLDFGNAWLATILLETTDPEPTYQDASNQTVGADSLTGSIGTGIGAAKRFIEDDVEPHSVVADPGALGREAVRFRSRWLWATGDANVSTIKSIGIHFSATGDAAVATASQRGRAARIRLKDPGGSPETVTKTSSHVLAIQYDYTLLAI